MENFIFYALIFDVINPYSREELSKSYKPQNKFIALIFNKMSAVDRLCDFHADISAI